MDDFALVLNAGSSSLKFCVFQRPDGERWRLGARGQIEGIGTSPRLSVKDANLRKVADEQLDTSSVQNGSDAIGALAVWLRSQYAGARVLGVGHRVVHGGAKFTKPVVVTPEVLTELKKLIPLAPLHQPYNLAAIEAVAERLPGVPQVACFDTSFHRDHAPVADLIPLPREICEGGLQRYGFHGLSYEYIASTLPEVAPDIAKGKVIVAHLGSGASLCALNDGKSVDTTMGFTAVEGLCMGTRPGSIDPGAVLYLFQNLGLSVKEVEAILYKKSGLIGISGISNDMRDLLGRAEPEAKLAVDYFIYRITKEIGALAGALGGVDALVFTAGIGENSSEIRQRVCEASAWLGIEIDAEANGQNAAKISTSQSKLSVWVIPTNEELMIALHTGDLLGLRSQTAEQAA
jgi:acetate kinase